MDESEQALFADIKKLSDKITNYDTFKREIKEVTSQHKNTLQAECKRVDTLDQAVSKITGAQELYQRQVEALQEKFTESERRQSSFPELQKNYKEIKAKQDALEQRVGGLIAQISRSRDDLKQAKQIFNIKITTLMEEQEEKVQASIQKLRTQIERKQETWQTLLLTYEAQHKEEMVLLSRQIRELESASKSSAAIKKDVTHLRQAVKALSNSKAARQSLDVQEQFRVFEMRLRAVEDASQHSGANSKKQKSTEPHAGGKRQCVTASSTAVTCPPRSNRSLRRDIHAKGSEVLDTLYRFKCGQCEDFSASSYADAWKHKEQMHQDLHVCCPFDRCASQFINEHKCKTHILLKHLPPELDTPTPQTEVNKVECGACKMDFSTFAEMKTHLEATRHHFTLACLHCKDNAFDNFEQLTRHTLFFHSDLTQFPKKTLTLL